MTTTSFPSDLSTELALREQWDAEGRAARQEQLNVIIRRAMPLTVLSTVDVLYPYRDFEGRTRYRKVRETRELPL